MLSLARTPRSKHHTAKPINNNTKTRPKHLMKSEYKKSVIICVISVIKCSTILNYKLLTPHFEVIRRQ